MGGVTCLMTSGGSAHHYTNPQADSVDYRRVSLHPRYGKASGSGCRELVGDMSQRGGDRQRTKHLQQSVGTGPNCWQSFIKLNSPRDV